MADKTDKTDKSDKSDKSEKAGRSGSRTTAVRSRVAQVVWLLFVLAAVFLAAGALCIALDLNKDNPLVAFVLGGADAVDLGIFSRKGGIKEFSGDGADTKSALFNWGLGAVAWLVVGRIVERLIKP